MRPNGTSVERRRAFCDGRVNAALDRVALQMRFLSLLTVRDLFKLERHRFEVESQPGSLLKNIQAEEAVVEQVDRSGRCSGWDVISPLAPLIGALGRTSQ